MIAQRPAREPAEVIIVAATALLGVVLALGVAFGLWRELQHTIEQSMLRTAVASIGLGFALIGVSLSGDSPKSASARLFLTIFGPLLLVAFFLGNGVFAFIAH